MPRYIYFTTIFISIRLLIQTRGLGHHDYWLISSKIADFVQKNNSIKNLKNPQKIQENAVLKSGAHKL